MRRPLVAISFPHSILLDSGVTFDHELNSRRIKVVSTPKKLQLLYPCKVQIKKGCTLGIQPLQNY